jgi:hypothetical protein
MDLKVTGCEVRELTEDWVFVLTGMDYDALF